MSPQAIFLILLAAIAVNLVIMTALIATPLIRRWSRDRGSQEEPEFESGQTGYGNGWPTPSRRSEGPADRAAPGGLEAGLRQQATAPSAEAPGMSGSTRPVATSATAPPGNLATAFSQSVASGEPPASRPVDAPDHLAEAQQPRDSTSANASADASPLHPGPTLPAGDGVLLRHHRRGRRFRVPAHDDPRASSAIQSFLDRGGPGRAERRPPATDRRHERPPRGATGERTAGRGIPTASAIWPVDPLTGLGNRVAWDALVASEAEWLAGGQPASVVVVEVTADRPGASDGGRGAGHGTGPAEDIPPAAAWMPALAGALRAELRSSDLLARLAPGLVAGLLTGTSGEQALVVVERVRRVAETSLAARPMHVAVATGAADVAACGGVEPALREATRRARLRRAAREDNAASDAGPMRGDQFQPPIDLRRPPASPPGTGASS